jgi:hypothetical protein
LVNQPLTKQFRWNKKSKQWIIIKYKLEIRLPFTSTILIRNSIIDDDAWIKTVIMYWYLLRIRILIHRPLLHNIVFLFSSISHFIFLCFFSLRFSNFFQFLSSDSFFLISPPVFVFFLVCLRQHQQCYLRKSTSSATYGPTCEQFEMWRVLFVF